MERSRNPQGKKHCYFFFQVIVTLKPPSAPRTQPSGTSLYVSLNFDLIRSISISSSVSWPLPVSLTNCIVKLLQQPI